MGLSDQNFNFLLRMDRQKHILWIPRLWVDR